MEWVGDWLGTLLRCDVATGPRLLVILLGAVASTVTITIGGHTIYRRIFGPSGPVRRSARALRDEGEARASRGEPVRAMQLYNLSIQTNPKSAHAYYLRGLLKEQMGDLNRAIADWQRCLARLRTHGDAFAKLLHYERPPSRYPAGWRLAFGAATLVALITLIGIWILLNDRSSDHGTRAAQAQHGTER